MVELFRLHDFLDRATCESIVAEMRGAGETSAPVYGAGGGDAGSIDSRVRRVSLIATPDALRQTMNRSFEGVKPQIEEHFGLVLSHCEDAQFLHYRAGDFFVAHQDGNTSLIRDDSRHRRISIVLFLNDQSADPAPGTYGGGDLMLHGRYPDWQARHPAGGAAGTLVAFRSETTHEVTPVTHGDRYTVVTWYR
jgi:predicted 2-oxoglutarate/Fe(II)-dependent dioxygenase YbiX